MRRSLIVWKESTSVRHANERLLFNRSIECNSMHISFTASVIFSSYENIQACVNTAIQEFVDVMLGVSQGCTVNEQCMVTRMSQFRRAKKQ